MNIFSTKYERELHAVGDALDHDGNEPLLIVWFKNGPEEGYFMIQSIKSFNADVIWQEREYFEVGEIVDAVWPTKTRTPCQECQRRKRDEPKYMIYVESLRDHVQIAESELERLTTRKDVSIRSTTTKLGQQFFFLHVKESNDSKGNE